MNAPLDSSREITHITPSVSYTDRNTQLPDRRQRRRRQKKHAENELTEAQLEELQQDQDPQDDDHDPDPDGNLDFLV